MKKNILLKIIIGMLAVVLIAAVLTFFWLTTDTFRTSPVLLRVEQDGRAISSDSIDATSGAEFDCVYTLGVLMPKSLRSYSVRIVPHVSTAEKDFIFSVDGKPRRFSGAGDLSAAFKIVRKTNSFRVEAWQDMDSVLETAFPGSTVKAAQHDVSALPYFEIEITAFGRVRARIPFIYTPSDTIDKIELDPPQIIF